MYYFLYSRQLSSQPFESLSHVIPLPLRQTLTKLLILLKIYFMYSRGIYICDSMRLSHVMLQNLLQHEIVYKNTQSFQHVTNTCDNRMHYKSLTHPHNIRYMPVTAKSAAVAMMQQAIKQVTSAIPASASTSASLFVYILFSIVSIPHVTATCKPNR